LLNDFFIVYRAVLTYIVLERGKIGDGDDDSGGDVGRDNV